jgi:hypothetical protein
LGVGFVATRCRCSCPALVFEGNIVAESATAPKTAARVKRVESFMQISSIK